MTSTESTGSTTTDRTPTRTDLAERIAWLEALAAEAATAAKEVRAELEGQASAEAANGCTPSWRLRGIGQVSGRETTDRVTVVDEGKFLAWVQERHPEQIEQRVRPAYAKQMCEKGTKRSGNAEAPGEVVDKAGEVVPGLEWQAGGRFLGIAFKVDDDAKQVFALAAGMALTEAMRGPGSPFAEDMRQAAEAVELLAGETAGTDEVPA